MYSAYEAEVHSQCWDTTKSFSSGRVPSFLLQIKILKAFLLLQISLFFSGHRSILRVLWGNVFDYEYTSLWQQLTIFMHPIFVVHAWVRDDFIEIHISSFGMHVHQTPILHFFFPQAHLSRIRSRWTSCYLLESVSLKVGESPYRKFEIQYSSESLGQSIKVGPARSEVSAALWSFFFTSKILI